MRPVLFVSAYESYTDREPPGLHTSAVALELLHSVILIRDDMEELTNGQAPNGEDPEWCDLRDGKLTLPVWFAMKHCDRSDLLRPY